MEPTYFDNWSANMAWLLGYIWTDGTVANRPSARRLGFRCAVHDEHIIHDIRNELKCDSPVQRFAGGRRFICGHWATVQDQVGFRVNCAPAVKSVAERHGIPPNKSNTDPPMPSIPDEWMPHFARGVLDGDGSLKVGRRSGCLMVAFYGSHLFIEQFRRRVADTAGVRLPNRLQHSGTKKLSTAVWGAQSEVLRLLKWLYPDGEYLALQRKRTKAMAYITAPPTPLLRKRKPPRICRVAECGRPHCAKGMCNTCYAWSSRHDGVTPTTPPNAATRRPRP